MKTPLEYINQARAILDLPPLGAMPRGVRDDYWNCPVARAFPKEFEPDVGASWLHLPVKFDTLELIAKAWGTRAGFCGVLLPDVLRDFVRDFDNGKYPELETDQ